MEEQTSTPAEATMNPSVEQQAAPPAPAVQQDASATPAPQPESAPSATPAPTAEATPAASSGNGNQKILIIEDERPLAHALELKLGHSGFDATAVNSGEDAIVALQKDRFDIILLDLILPGMDGFDLLKKIREKDKNTKIVVLSNLGQPEDKARTEEYNITDYYIKSNIPLAAVVQSIQSLS